MKLTVAVFGALTYAAGGGYVGAMNAGWIERQGANPFLGVLGLGGLLIVAGFARSGFNSRLGQTGGLGRTAQVLLVLGPALYVVSWLIEFAIIGTLTLGVGLICLAVAVIRYRLAAPLDRALIALSAVGSVTWNTETTSAFLLVGVGLAWVVLSLRLLPEGAEVST